MNQKMMVILVVGVLLVAGGVAVGIAMSGTNKDPSYGDSKNDQGRLTIFGNANNDDYIDQRDVDFVKEIISGEKEAIYFDCYKTYGGTAVSRSYADANCDGKIDESDVKWIQRMVDREKNMMIYYFDVDSVIASCTYPLTTMAIGYKSNFEAVLICGAADRCLYACDQVANNGTYSQWYSAFSSAKNMGNRFNPDYEVFYKEGNEKPGCIVTGTRAWYDPLMEERVAPKGIDVVRLAFWEDNIATSGIITLAYLLDTEDKGYDYMKKADAVTEKIAEYVKDKKKADRPLVVVLNNQNKIVTLHNGVQEGIWYAGGKCPIDVGYVAGGVIDEEGLYNLKADLIVYRLDYGLLGGEFKDHDTTKQTMYNKAANTDHQYLKMAKNTDAYNKGNVIFISQGIYMGPASYVAVAYMANHIYSDLNFDVDSMFKDYIETYHPDYTFEQMDTINYYTMKELQDYLAA